MKDKKLWDKIEGWSLPGGDGFVSALAGELGCSEDDAKALVLEYRRYAYLGALLKTGKRAPSAPVRRVLAAHKKDEANYSAFCTEILGKPLVPGDPKSAGRSKAEYATRQAYLREFGTKPLAKHWPDPNRWVFRVMAGVFVVGGLAGSMADGSVWPALAGLGIAALILFMKKKPGSGNDDAAFHAIIGND